MIELSSNGKIIENFNPIDAKRWFLKTISERNISISYFYRNYEKFYEF